MITTNCPSCRCGLRLADGQVGGLAICPTCGARFRVPASAAPRPAAGDPQPAAARRSDADRVYGAVGRAAPSIATGLARAVVALVTGIAVLAMLCVAAMAGMDRAIAPAATLVVLTVLMLLAWRIARLLEEALKCLKRVEKKM